MNEPTKKAPANRGEVQLEPLHPKYRIAELVRNRFGELAYNTGLNQLAKHCGIKRKQTIAEWLAIEAGSNKEIHHLVMPLVLSFFNMQTENQLLTKAHKDLLRTKKAVAA